MDVNKVSQIVQGILSENVRIFTAFYDREIVRRLNDKMDQAEIISQIGPALNAEIERLTDEFQSYMDIPELSLPEKKATLAQLLGEDDDLLTGYMFNKKQLVIDDCSREVLDLFVEANNKLCALDDTSEIEKAQIDRIKEYAALSKGGQPVKLASQLIDELKETKVTMRESTNYIRQKSLELEGLDIQRKDHKESYKRLTNDGFVFEGRTYRLQGDVEEPNLEEEYKPMQTVPSSIDLRSYLGNLKTWREQEIASMDMCPLERDPFLTLISNGTLDEFFESNRDEITKGLELSKMFKDRYKVQEAEIVKFKNGLKSTLVKLLFESIKDFSIFKYVTNAADYPYVNRNYTDIDALMRQMDSKSNPFVRMNPTVVATEGINTYCKMMFLHTDEDDDRRKWEDACGRNFGNTPTLHSAESRFKVTLLQLKGVAPDEISVLS